MKKTSEQSCKEEFISEINSLKLRTSINWQNGEVDRISTVLSKTDEGMNIYSSIYFRNITIDIKDIDQLIVELQLHKQKLQLAHAARKQQEALKAAQKALEENKCFMFKMKKKDI